MTFHDLSRPATSARQRLVEATGSPFAPGTETKPVVDVLDGRTTHEDIGPKDWINALAVTDGLVGVYFYLVADHEWWLAYDDTGPDAYGDDLDGPFHHWSTYPSGPWEHSALPRGILQQCLEDLYWLHDARKDESDIYRSKVVKIEDAPEFVRREVRGEGDE